MLEVGAILRTWKLFTLPKYDTEMIAIASFDHRLVYLDYEGPISDNRGSVTRFDSGSFDWITNENRRIVIKLSGARLTGIADILNSTDEEWHLTIRKEKLS